MKMSLLVFLIISTFLSLTLNLTYKLSIDTKSLSSSISSYNQDLATCTCNLHPSICDNFCCCDTTCSSAQVTTWTISKVCKSEGLGIQKFCDQLQQGGYFSFDDLACVYQSNRGMIGYFYQYPTTGNINYPTPKKFVNQIPTLVIDQASASAGTNSYSSTYSSDNYLKVKQNNVMKYLEIWTPVSGGECGIGFVNITKSTSYSCEYPLSGETCSKSSSYLQGTILLCKTGDCTSNQSLGTVPISSSDGISCNNMITSQKIDITLSSSGSSYIIDSITLTLNTNNIALSSNQRYSLSTIININKPITSIQYSGNPGYQVGKPVGLIKTGVPYNLFSIADAAGNCLVTGVAKLVVLFGQNQVYSCASANPCSSNLYIDSIAKQSTLTLSKWARTSNDTIPISGNLNTCSFETTTFNILYSEAGWLLDKQPYIISSSFTTESSSQASWNRKYFKINWIYVNPSEISTPPTNNFYQFFSYMWTPLRQYFGVG